MATVRSMPGAGRTIRNRSPGKPTPTPSRLAPSVDGALDLVEVVGGERGFADRGRLDLDAHFLDLGQDVRAEELDRLHDRVVREVAELHVADQLVDAELGVLD